MIDEDLNPWLIEVNTNPNLELSCPYLARFIPQLLENACKIAIDPIYPPPAWPAAKKHLLPDA
jgi:tubulin--tyrosine ligase